MATADPLMCVGCGKPIENGEKAIRVTEGKVQRSDFKSQALYGDMHVSCFRQLVGSADAVLAELEEQSRVA